MKHFDEKRHDFTPYGLTCELWEPRQMLRPDRHDEIEFNYLDQGNLTYLIGGRRVTLEPRRLNFFWAAVPHQIVAFAEVSFYYVVTVPFGWMFQWGLPDPMLTALMHGQVVTDSESANDSLDPIFLKRWHLDLETASETSREVVMLELQARLKRMALKFRAKKDVVLSQPATSSLRTNLEKAEAMACFVARNYTKRLLVNDIAACIGLNSDYASTLFRKSFGMTLTDLITQHRVAHAQRKLVTTNDQIIDIAQDSGFDSLSRFNRAFKELSGITPREFRRTKALGCWQRNLRPASVTKNPGEK